METFAIVDGLPPFSLYVGLGSGGGGVDAAGGHVVGGALDGVAGERVGVVDPNLAATGRGAVVVEERCARASRSRPGDA